ncbi:unnamed protein product [Eruca vesicaria subsp. sativa]|uniref:DUF1985 domain-containing protein n=1 Tax=Eruca vesicaria subsp. sativa TaxID=29727 RepID=A0ABC8KAT3_ERUVS|nr:unnamed protein product [Eruca vesicaria subsp. sativa]
MVGLLGLPSIGIFGISSNSMTPFHCAIRVMDKAAFQRYPWGQLGFSSLVQSIKMITFQAEKSYTVRGCVHVLLIWIYEFVPGIGEKYGNQIEGADVPLLSWGRGGGGGVRVRHMVMKLVEEIYPKWANDEFDPELDNLIKDIFDGQLNEKFWDVTSTTKSPEKRK